MSNSELGVELLGGVRVTRDGDAVRLAPFQAALTALVFTTGEISRPSIARHLWVGEFDSRARQRLRQLISMTRKRVGVDLFEIEDDLLRPSPDIVSDAQELMTAILESRLEEGARLLTLGPLAPDLEGLPDQFDDWRERIWRGWRQSIVEAARTAWPLHSQAGEWAPARDAAEAMIVIDPLDEAWVGRLIEARGRNGQARAAEVAYAEYCSRLPPRETPDEDVTALIEVVRGLPGVTSTRGPRQPDFVGRRESIEAIRPLFDEVRHGRPGFAIVSGEAGIGKTRLLDELRRTAHLDGFRCLHARAVEFERIIALNPLIDALQPVDLEAHLSLLGEPWRTVVGEVLPPGSLAEPIGDLPLIQEENLPRRLFDAFSLLFDSIAREQPTILFLDDLHWADSTTVSTLQFFQRRSTGTPFGVIASVRPEAVESKDPCKPLLKDDAEIVSHRARLRDLTENDARALVRDVMSDMANEDDVEAVIQTAGCHPLYLIETARNRAEARPSDGSPFPPMAVVPVSLKEILSSRTRGLSDDARSMCALMAIGSGRMTLGDLADLTGDSIDHVVEVSEELQSARIVHGERDRIWIAHDLFRSAIYHELSEPRRAMLHRRMALFLSDRDDPPADELATHLDRAGDAEGASAYGWIAGERCLARGTVAEAAHFYELTARNETEPTRIAEATARQGVAHHLGRNMARAAPVLELAALRLRAVGDPQRARRLDIRRVEALAEGEGAVTSDLVARLRAIKEEAREQKDWEAVALALDGEIQLLYATGNLHAISEVLRECRVISTMPESSAAAAANISLALDVVFGDPDEGIASAERALELTSDGGDHRLSALLRAMAMRQLRGRTALSGFDVLVDEARARARAAGDIRVRFSIETNLATAALDAGDHDRAEVLFQNAEELLGNAEMDHARFNHWNNLGEMHLARRAYPAARDAFLRAEEHLGLTTPPYASQAIVAGLGLCALESGDLGEARRRREQLSVPVAPLYYDPSTMVAFEVRFLERLQEHEAAITLMQMVTDELDGRLELAWLKSVCLLAEKQLKWSRTEGALPLVRRAQAIARELLLSHREAELEGLAKSLNLADDPSS